MREYGDAYGDEYDEPYDEPYAPYGLAPSGLLYAAAFWFTADVRDAGIGGIAGAAEEAVMDAVVDGMAADVVAVADGRVDDEAPGRSHGFGGDAMAFFRRPSRWDRCGSNLREEGENLTRATPVLRDYGLSRVTVSERWATGRRGRRYVGAIQSQQSGALREACVCVESKRCA